MGEAALADAQVQAARIIETCQQQAVQITSAAELRVRESEAQRVALVEIPSNRQVLYLRKEEAATTG